MMEFHDMNVFSAAAAVQHPQPHVNDAASLMDQESTFPQSQPTRVGIVSNINVLSYGSLPQPQGGSGAIGIIFSLASSSELKVERILPGTVASRVSAHQLRIGDLITVINGLLVSSMSTDTSGIIRAFKRAQFPTPIMLVRRGRVIKRNNVTIRIDNPFMAPPEQPLIELTDSGSEYSTRTLTAMLHSTALNVENGLMLCDFL